MAKTHISEYQKNGLTHIQLDNEEIRATFLPEIGGKMIELINLKTGRQFLLEPQNQSGTYQKAYYGADFGDYDTSGFDECFPTIEESIYPLPTGQNETREAVFPDHGELWSAGWQFELQKDFLMLRFDGINFPYRFEKLIRLSENQIILDYHLKNLSDVQFSYIWSAHPLLHVNPGDQLLISDSVKDVLINWASDQNFAKYGDTLPWPHLSAERPEINYSVVQNETMDMAIKCFTPALEKGIAGIYDEKNDESLFFQFNPAELPFLGIWLCYGGWPVNGQRKHLTVGLEPASGRPDSLRKAIQRNESSRVDAKKVNQWTLTMSVWKGLPKLAGGLNGNS